MNLKTKRNKIVDGIQIYNDVREFITDFRKK